MKIQLTQDQEDKIAIFVLKDILFIFKHKDNDAKNREQIKIIKEAITIVKSTP